MAKKKKPISFVEKMKKFSKAGIVGSKSPNRTAGNLEDLKTLEERLQFLLNIVKQPKRPSHYMLFFVMYDIESNRVRNQIVKYLIRTGCTRVQNQSFSLICRSQYTMRFAPISQKYNSVMITKIVY